jgi:hypothetical protein
MKDRRLLRRLRWGRLLLLLGLGLWVAASWPTYQPPGRPAIRLRLNYLERVIQEGAGPTTALGQLTAQNAEWGLFTLSFSTYGLADVPGQGAWRPLP